VTRYALAYPEIGFFVKSDGAEVLAAPSSPSLRNKISHLYGPEVAKNMIEVAFKGVVEVSGLIGIPAIARKTRSMENLFVNRRFVKSQLLTDALESAYKTLLFLERKPVAVLNIAIEPLMVDVNVHPTKLEVKFEDPDAVFSAVHLAVKRALEGNELLESHEGQSMLSKVLRAHDAAPFETSEQTMLLKDKPQKKQYRVLGQVARSFIVAEVADGLLLVDQHAAAERINLERLHKTQNAIEKSQQLLQPVIVSPPKPQAPIIRAHLEYLKQLGFDIEGFGQNDFLVRQVPVVFSEVVSKQFLNALFDELADNIKKSRKELVNENIMYVMACKASVKANDELSMQEIHELLDALFACDQSYACAHGRPTIIKFTNYDLERMFKRK
jgi:DNA mismatch repair protein MutL